MLHLPPGEITSYVRYYKGPLQTAFSDFQWQTVIEYDERLRNFLLEINIAWCSRH